MVITAIYENGVLRPLTPLELPERAEVQVTIAPVATTEPIAHRRRVREILAAAGLSHPTNRDSTIAQPLSPEERTALAHRFTGDRPLADLIIEEREGR